MSKRYTIDYKLSGGGFRIYDSVTEKIETVDKLPMNDRKFKMLSYKDNESTDEDLLEYAKHFKQWCIELKNNNIVSIDYADCYSDYTAVTRTFNRFCKAKYNQHDAISVVEYEWFEKCANCGLQYIKDKDSTVQCYSYDFKNQYGLTLYSQNLIPSKQGSEIVLEKLPKRKHLQHGFYKVKITCDNDNFRKLFFFSKHNVYLDVSLKFAMKHRKKFKVKLELIQDGFPNAYQYEAKDMVTLNSITNEWFTKLTSLRKIYTQNRLLKHLISSCWGHLNANNKINMTWDEIQNKKLNVGTKSTYDYKILEYIEYQHRDYYVLLNTNSPYKCNIRLKPWITALSRNMTADIVMKNIDCVYRVQTDSVSFTQEMTFDDVNLVLEEKTTGNIHWNHVNSYHNITTGYKTKNYAASSSDSGYDTFFNPAN